MSIIVNSQDLSLAIVGEFQIGKSTLVNCLLGKQVAILGDGLSTTKENICYQLNKTISVIDTPGFNADVQDDKTAKEAIRQANVVVFLQAGKSLDNKVYPEIIELAHDLGKKCLFLFNCNNREFWNPTDTINSDICQDITARIKQLALENAFIPIEKQMVFPVNLYWAAYALKVLGTAQKNSGRIKNLIKDESWYDDSNEKNLQQQLLEHSGFLALKKCFHAISLEIFNDIINNQEKQIEHFITSFMNKLKQNLYTEVSDGTLSTCKQK